MGLSKNIKMVMLDKNIKISELANRLNIDAKVLSVKLSRDNLSGKSIIDIANALECDVKFVDRAGGKVYWLPCLYSPDYFFLPLPLYERGDVLY